MLHNRLRAGLRPISHCGFDSTAPHRIKPSARSCSLQIVLVMPSGLWYSPLPSTLQADEPSQRKHQCGKHCFQFCSFCCWLSASRRKPAPRPPGSTFNALSSPRVRSKSNLQAQAEPLTPAQVTAAREDSSIRWQKAAEQSSPIILPPPGFQDFDDRPMLRGDCNPPGRYACSRPGRSSQK